VVLNEISLAIERGELVTLLGPSGCGKSTLLFVLAGLFTHGEVEVSGRVLCPDKRRVALILQDYGLLPWKTVWDNAALGLTIRGAAGQEKQMVVGQLLKELGLWELRERFPAQLSGGQRQRVAIARCLAMDPEIMLLDEPTSALDPAMTNEVLSIVKKLVGRGLTMLIVTHEMSFAQEVASRVLFIEDGEIYEDGVPSVIFENPRREKTRAFIARLNMLNFEIRSSSYDFVAMNAKIEVFCSNYGVSRQKTYALQLVLEELIMMIIKQCYAAIEPEVELSIAYKKEADEITIYFYYKASAFNPFELHRGDLENLGIVLIDNYVKKHEHAHDGLRNRILVTLVSRFSPVLAFERAGQRRVGAEMGETVGQSCGGEQSA